jgi:L-sorbose 1-phosphate reductase
MNYTLPKTQWALQLVGPDQLTLNKAKPVIPPGPHQIVCRVEAAGLCFSDLKLLKQFSQHARKTEILSGIDPSVLREIPSYVPGEKPAVPGHETVVRVWAVGEKITRFKPGERYLVQTDYRWLPTANSNGAFGYTFEGGLQEFVLLDERVIISPDGDSMLIPASDSLGASAIALVEPWACVEDAYAAPERTTIKSGGHTLIVADNAIDAKQFKSFFDRFGRPGRITWCAGDKAPSDLGEAVKAVTSLDQVTDGSCDDVMYFGSRPETVEALFLKIAARGLFNIILGGGSLDRKVTTAVGRVHYGGIRITGTAGSNPADAMAAIPPSGEIRKGDNIHVIGAGGPMGVMHVIRNLCQGVANITIYAGDVDENRLAILARLAEPLAEKNRAGFKKYNPKTATDHPEFDYVALMAPIPALVEQAVDTAAERAIINIFAGIPAGVTASIDLDRYIRRNMYFIGTSGSVLSDMITVLGKVESGRLDTDVSVAAVAGLDGAVDGIRAVEHRKIDGKIIVYPTCKGLPLTPLENLHQYAPQASQFLSDGRWNRQAEKTLLSHYQNSL